MLGRHRTAGTPDGGGSAGPGSGAAAPAPVDDHDLPARKLVHRIQERPMSCSVSSIKSAGEAFGRKMGSEDKIRGRTESLKRGTYDVGARGKGIPHTRLAHTEGMGNYSLSATKHNLKRIEGRRDVPFIVTNVGGGKHVMPARSGSPQGREGHIELLDPMSKTGSVFKPYDEVFGGAPFKIGRMSHTLDSLYGIAPQRQAVAPRSPSMESLESTDEGLTRTKGKVPKASPSHLRRK